MPRKVRQISKSSIYHVMLRGNERKCLFVDEDDRQVFLNILDKVRCCSKEESVKLIQKCFSLYAYCMMDNHIHLLINQGDDNISRIMKKIETRYAHHFNKKYSRVGHLFQDRFKSEAVDDDGYLLAVTRYIHNNPIRAGIADDPSKYKWSSYNDYISSNVTSGLINKKVILDLFSKDYDRSVKQFISFSKTENKDNFLECNEIVQKRNVLTKDEIIGFLEEFLNDKAVSKDSLIDRKYSVLRNELILKIRAVSILSIREIAELLGIDRGIVQRTISKA